MDDSRFVTIPFRIADRTVILLPAHISTELPSRGAVLIQGSINGIPFKTVAEPDGRGSHWFSLEIPLLQQTGAAAGKTAEVLVESSSDWPEPEIPADLSAALESSNEARATWSATTPMARWDWIRWIRSTKNPGTRLKRIAAACDKLAAGERRPCCFNRSLCTDPEVSEKGVLICP